MNLAQRLYEAGHITYMRTDSTSISTDALNAVREHIGEAYGARYLPASPNRYASKSTAQEAHEAIRPTDLGGEVAVRDMEPDARRLYDLIWRQFVASQMSQAEYLATSVTVVAGEFELRVRGRILQFDGHTRVQPSLARGGEDTPLPDFVVGEALALKDLRGSAALYATTSPLRRGELGARA